MNRGTTIFIPVYNEEDRVEQAIRSAAPQCEKLLVSDNASTDGTEAVCRRLQSEYSHMQYFRQDENIGALANWYFLLKQVATPYVMALGSHDYLGVESVQHLQLALEERPDVEIAASEIYLEQDGEIIKNEQFSQWSGADQDDGKSRVHACIFDRADQSWAMYGLFRTSTLKQILLEEENPTYAVDVVVITKVAALGKIIVVPNTRYVGWIRLVRKARTSYLDRLTGHQTAPQQSFELRNEFRQVLFDFYASANEWESGLRRQLGRMSFMVRVGMFKRQAFDLGFILMFLPVKVNRAIRRMFR